MATLAASASAEDVDVRFVDQEKINEFGKLNNRLLEIRADLTQYKADAEVLDDATAELMMASDGKVMLMIGDSFVEVSDGYANEYCEKKQEALREKSERFAAEENDILKRQETLKKDLYSRFGDSINLEN